jgi:ketopantoate reductase
MVEPEFALVVSDFPIVGCTVESVFRAQYEVVSRSWPAFVAHPVVGATLVIIDVTTKDTNAALSLIAQLLPEARVVVCSLNQNEVHVYVIDKSGCREDAAFPNLFALSA